MTSLARAKSTVALLLGAATSVVANPVIDASVASIFDTHDTATADMRSVATAPAVWTATAPPTNDLAGRDWSDESASVRKYCTQVQYLVGQDPVEQCFTVTHPLVYTTRTVTHYPALPTASEGRCGPTFNVTELTDERSPWAADCIELAHRISGEGQWKVSSFILATWHQLVEWGTCAFGMRAPAIDSLVMVGNQDIIDILVDAVRDFTRDGRVAAEGRMFCTTRTGPQVVWYNEWTIYHHESSFHEIAKGDEVV